MSSVDAGRRLIGRDAALATTGAALTDASTGTGGLLLVVGEPGIGKSAVLGEQSRLAVAGGARVLRGVGWQGSGVPPYWLWSQVLRGLEPGELGDARRLLDLAAAEVGAAAEAARARFRLFEAVRAALAALARSAPTLVVLDDLQWADDSSLHLLEHVRRGLAAERVLFLGAYRDGEAGAALRDLAATCATVPLAGLDSTGVTALMAAVAGPVPDAELAATVRRRCGGNPFFVRELTRLMVARGEWSAATVAVPDGVRDLLRMRLARLSPPCADLLELAAVAGADIAPPLLAEATAAVAGHVEELLEEAARARVLATDGASWRFAHDLYRETALAQISAARKPQLHATVGRALHVLSAHGSDPAAVGGAARLAAHFVAAGPATRAEALRYSVLAAEEATARLGHEDAAGHYTTALGLLGDTRADRARRVELLVGLGAAWHRAGDHEATRATYLRAAELARQATDALALADVALGVAALGARAGSDDPVSIGLLEEAAELLAHPAGEPSEHPVAHHMSQSCDVLRSRVLAALARALRHGEYGAPNPRAAASATDAVALARASGDAAALGHALLAQHDVVWAPGTAGVRLPVLAEMAAAAHRGHDRDLAAEATMLRAAALIEQGDPAGMVELQRYTRLAERLGHARGRWGSLSRRATLAQLTGRVEEGVAFANEALELGRAIGLPDAMGCFATLRGSLAALGAPVLPLIELMPTADPLWPVYPLLRAWGQVQEGDLDAAAATMRGFSVQTVPEKHDLEFVAITATVFAAVGSAAQRQWTYRTFARYAGLHALVGGCAAYHGAVDHHLGVLAAASGHTEDAVRHFGAAIASYERLGATAWAELSRTELERLRPDPGAGEGDTFRLVEGLWRLRFAGREAHLPDAKGLRDIATLLAAPHQPIHVHTLLGHHVPAGADPVLDHRAVAEFRARLADLRADIDEAEQWGDPHRAERARAEQDALTAQLRAAHGLGGRTRRLGDDTERARKTVTARIRDVLRRVERAHPDLADHLRGALHTGTHCSYTPDPPRHWRL